MKYKIYAELTEFFSDGEKNPLLNVVIGLAALSGVLLFIVVAVVVLICKMRSTARNVIKKDFNPLYGMDYEAEEVNCSHSIFFFCLRTLPTRLDLLERKRTRKTLFVPKALTTSTTTWKTEGPTGPIFIWSLSK